MQAIDKDCFFRVDFEFLWTSLTATHRERFLARKVNFWRDFLPQDMEKAFLGLQVGDSVCLDYPAGQLVDIYSKNKVKSLSLKNFQSRQDQGQNIRPYFGRFYPKGFLSNVIGIYPENYYPFRVIKLSETEFDADLNHPLALYPIRVKATILEIAEKGSEFGGRCTVWMEEIAYCGPGMQARWQGQPTEFQVSNAMTRDDEAKDSLFYQQPRLVGHIDSQASYFLAEEYSRLLESGMRVLDLMSSVQSHLPENLDLEVVGLGMNKEEMCKNSQIDEAIVHDLNADPVLPFADGEFEAIVCSLSIEYLVNPEKVMQEIVRVLKPNGVCFISFSNRWFPPKVTALWTEIHEFERLGLVQEYFLETGAFDNLHTYSVRNWWRPETDLRYPELIHSDPVFVVSGVKTSM